ncbi:FtsX-like permease family protein [Nonomuraea sp. NPDC048826]|uniref:FtsX-like permease family protein n=1 Tax=Nonomuraea sp. NPDC048826 TaxID=3364347 RepID=UPI00370FBA81
MILRGLWERRALALVVLLIAVVPIASAAVAPIYSAAALTTIVRDAMQEAPVDGRGWRYTSTGGTIEAKVAGFTAGADFVDPPVFGMEVSSASSEQDDPRAYTLVWQDGQCEHLELARGRCPGAAREVMASEASGLEIGDVVRLRSIRAAEPGATTLDSVPLEVVGVYLPGDLADPYWFGRTLFDPAGQPSQSKVDALFTVRETRTVTYFVSGGPEEGSWTDYALIHIAPDRLAGTDLPLLAEMQALAEATGRDTDAIVFSRVADTLKTINANAETLGVPALLVAAQLVGLGWLLLFQTVGDLVRARGPEIALARLRGHGRPRVWRFALAEPLLLLLLAVPVGLAAGFGAAKLMIGALLPAGIPATFPPLAVAAGLAAMLGGVLAATASAWRIATRPITEEWRRTPRRSARGWVLDAIVLAITALGLTELLAAGVITDASGESTAALAVPGLMALGVALLASRVLPVVSGWLFGLTRRRGGLGPFLALRQVARGPVTSGSVIVLGTALGLATFAVAAWTATSGDYARVAAFHNGAPAVINVDAVEPSRLAAAVEAADPEGVAAPVIKMRGTPQLVVADPERLARVAHWDPALAGGVSLAEAMAALPGPDAARVWVRGDRFRLQLAHGELPRGWEAQITATFRITGRVGPVAIPMGKLRAAGGAYEWNLPLPCRQVACELRRIHGDLTPLETVEGGAFTEVRVEKMEVRQDGRWQTLPTPVWRVDQDPDRTDGSFALTDVGVQVLRPATHDQEPAGIVVGDVGARAVPGLDSAFTYRVRAAVAAAAAPGITDVGVLMDFEQADRISYGVHENAEFQVWTRQADTAALERALAGEGLTVVSTVRDSDLEAGYAAEGPGLALMLLLVSALAAAVLALGRTVLALYTAARRRGYELAALEAAGAKVPALRVALLLEQAITVLAGTLAGLLAGLLAARAALGRIPQFAEPVVTPPLPHEVAAAPVALVTGGALAATLLCALLISELLLRGIRVERLRDTPA